MRIFVYGTLKKGGSNHQFLAGKTLERYSWVEGWDLFNLGPYPCACKGTGRIAVEAYIITPTDLYLLDELEGYPILYNRMEVVDTAGTKGLLYYMEEAPIGASLIENGIWKV